jgi:endonuclease YncB( thermonuclease family)
VNLSLVSGGFAVPLSIAPNTAHENDFVAAAIEAERTNIGLWAQCRR